MSRQDMIWKLLNDFERENPGCNRATRLTVFESLNRLTDDELRLLMRGVK